MVAIQVKPRLSIYLKQRVCQLRLINLGKPFSIDKILNQVSLEGWDPLPSRGTVQNIVHNLDQVKSEKKVLMVNLCGRIYLYLVFLGIQEKLF